MNKIRFSHVWDKLRDPEFTTIRTWTKEKEEYYKEHTGEEFQVWKAKEAYPFRLEYASLLYGLQYPVTDIATPIYFCFCHFSSMD